jgi:hypothetical protein
MSGAIEIRGRRVPGAALAVSCLAVLASLAWPSSGFAAAPALTIYSPHGVVKVATPTVAGTSSDETLPAPPVKVSIYVLPTSEGAEPIERMTAEENPGNLNWAATPETPLPNGLYEAVAEQTEGAETGRAEAVFTVNTTPPPPPPTPAIAYPLAGTASVGESQLFSGTASTGSPNRPQVTVEVFSGGAVSRPALRSLSIPVASNGLWNGTVGGLAPGTYTAQAVQQGDGEGRSASVTFTLTAPVSRPAAPPTASFTWFPGAPAVGDSVVLVSSSTDLASPITSFAWDVLGGGAFKPGGPVLSTSFSSPGDHKVRLQVVDGRGAAATVSKTIPVSAQALHPMQPFPLVRIAGVKTSYGVRLSALSVQSPVGAHVTVACKGRACKKLRSQSRVATASATNRHASAVVLAFRSFERPYGAGATLQIRVFAAGEIGKYTSFTIHRRGLPTREDQCLSALDPHPIPCPA